MERQVKSRQRVADHGEVFTAQREVDAMCDLVKQETERIDSRFLEPACGDGNFLSVILKRKLTSMPRSTSWRKQATPTTKPSFPSPPATYPFLSGTPFRAINSGEFIENQIYNWTYSDEQRAKESWVGSGNPYLSLPRMVMLTYRIPDSIRQIAMQGEFNEFDLNVFFSAKGKDDEARFVYENEVQKWLDLIRGSYLPSNIDDMKLGQDKRPPMPYSDTRLLNVLSHTLWFLPNVASCQAMYNLWLSFS